MKYRSMLNEYKGLKTDLEKNQKKVYFYRPN